MTYEANRRVETSVRTLRIVEHLSEVGPVGVSTLANELGLSKGIVHNHVSTLREEGYVRKIGDDYQLSPKMLTTGIRCRSNNDLYVHSNELLADFANRHDRGVVLLIRAATECHVVSTYQVPATHALDTGTTVPVRRSLPGIVILKTEAPTPDDIEISPIYKKREISHMLESSGYVTGPLTPESSSELVVLPVIDHQNDCHGAFGVLLHGGEDSARVQSVAESASALRERIETRLSPGEPSERSFATEKHSWLNK